MSCMHSAFLCNGSSKGWRWRRCNIGKPLVSLSLPVAVLAHFATVHCTLLFCSCHKNRQGTTDDDAGKRKREVGGKYFKSAFQVLVALLFSFDTRNSTLCRVSVVLFLSIPLFSTAAALGKPGKCHIFQKYFFSSSYWTNHTGNKLFTELVVCSYETTIGYRSSNVR